MLFNIKSKTYICIATCLYGMVV